LTGKPGNIREFGAVRELTDSGKCQEKNLSGKLNIANFTKCMFDAMLMFITVAGRFVSLVLRILLLI